MANIMTKCGTQDNVITCEHYCDTKADLANIPATKVEDEDFRDGKADLIALLVRGKMVPTRSEGRRAIEQGGVTVNDEKVTDVKKAYTKEEIGGGDFIVRKGKKSYMKFTV